jgi:phosphatidylinositol glycan class V
LESLVAICIAHTAHLLSVLVLFSLTRAIFASPVNSVFPLTASLLHILSPAGLFLSAPYAESSCALLSFLGCLLFMKSRVSRGQHTAGHDLLVVAAGLTFGIAATFRSNLILNGLLLLEEALRTLYYLRYEFNLIKVRRLIATGLGGLLVGVGFVLPQYIAYREYCAPSNIQSRPWCERALPSIYVFVQSYYW